MIVVFGSINLDLVARVARLPHEGETMAGTAFAALPGGKGANQALAARRAGAEVAMAGAVGTDGFAATAVRELIASGIDLQWLQRAAAPTGVALIHVDSAGRNAITIVAGANAAADAAVIPDTALKAGTTLILQLEVPTKAVCALAARAKQLGARVILNAAPAAELPAELLSVVDVLIVNEIEAAAIAAMQAMPTAPEDFATAFHRHYKSAVIVTLGAAGAIVAAEGAVLNVEAPKVNVVDTTGAGDALVGALAAALDRGADWTQAIAEGIAAGSLACTTVGAQAALPDRTAIRTLAPSVRAGVNRRPRK